MAIWLPVLPMETSWQKMTDCGDIVIKAVIFDMDGLMFDTERLAKAAWELVGEELGQPIDEQLISQIRGATPAASKEIFARSFGASFDYAAARQRRNALVAMQIEAEGVPVKPGLQHLLDALRAQKIPCAVASSSPRRVVEKYLSMTGLSDYFSAVIGAENVVNSKPAPDCFQAAANALETPSENCLVLEDSAAGLYATKAAGMKAVCIPDISLPEEDALGCAAAVLCSLHQVPGWLAQQNQHSYKENQ